MTIMCERKHMDDGIKFKCVDSWYRTVDVDIRPMFRKERFPVMTENASEE